MRNMGVPPFISSKNPIPQTYQARRPRAYFVLRGCSRSQMANGFARREWPLVVQRPVTSDDDRLGGRGSHMIPASCCVQYAIVEYWRCDAFGQQSEFNPTLPMTAQRSDGTMERPKPWPMEEDRCHSTEA